MKSEADFDKIVRPNVREDVFLTRKVEPCWLSKIDRSMEGVKRGINRYVGTENGVFRQVPCAPLSRFYDPRKRPWYMRSSSTQIRMY